MTEVFGFEESADEMEKFANNTDKATRSMHQVADTMARSARNNFQAQTTTRTGHGAAGIIVEKSREDTEIGWSSRPGLHGYFHELGTYKDPAKPHMRPAFDAHEQEFVRNVQQAITE